MRRQERIWVYSAQRWNALVEGYFRSRILSALVLERSPWRHPWHVSVAWDDVAGAWMASVTPGACWSATSDGDPVVLVDAISAPDESLERLGVERESGETRLRGYLSEGARLALRPGLFRAIGTDAVGSVSAPGEAVPAFFAERGVMGPRVLREMNGQAVLASAGLEAQRREARLLRACDIVLSHDRIATEVRLRSSDLSPGTAALEFGPVRPPGYEAEPMLSALRRWTPPVEFEPLDFAMGLQTDAGRDELLVATVYLLSEPGAAHGSEPADASWAPYVRHRLHWNVQYATRYSSLEVEPTRFETPIPILGAGELGRWSEGLVAELNGRTAELEALLSPVKSVGRFMML